jgi:hypothetical protein
VDELRRDRPWLEHQQQRAEPKGQQASSDSDPRGLRGLPAKLERFPTPYHQCNRKKDGSDYHDLHDQPPQSKLTYGETHK